MPHAASAAPIVVLGGLHARLPPLNTHFRCPTQVSPLQPLFLCFSDHCGRQLSMGIYPPLMSFGRPPHPYYKNTLFENSMTSEE